MSDARALTAPLLARPAAYASLTKPDVTFLVLLTTFAGFYMGARGPLDWALLGYALLGTTLVGAGTAALNHYIERDLDARMRRTAGRPLPLGLVRPAEALLLGVVLALAGVACLAWFSNALASLLALTTSVAYLAVYTPLKRYTTLATAIGAIPGALPPLIGWAAARGRLSLDAWILFGMIFLWQFPHFMAIAWMYREDYARAGIRMLPVVDRQGTATFGQIVVTAAALVPMSLLPSVVGLAGLRYFFGATIVGLALVQACLWAARTKSNSRAKFLMHATVVHIPILLALLMFDKLG